VRRRFLSRSFAAAGAGAHKETVAMPGLGHKQTSRGEFATSAAFFGGLRQPGMRADPFDSIFLGSEFPEMALLAIRPRYPHAPNAALLHWR